MLMYVCIKKWLGGRAAQKAQTSPSKRRYLFLLLTILIIFKGFIIRKNLNNVIQQNFILFVLLRVVNIYGILFYFRLWKVLN